MTQMPQSQARQLPLSMICELLGLPRADRPKFNSSGTELDARHGRRRLPECGPESLRECDAIGQFDAVRERGHEGLVAELVRVEKEGRKLSRSEMLAMLFLLLFAGHETMTHLISGSVCELLKDPGPRNWLSEDSTRTNLAVEEFLRFIFACPIHQTALNPQGRRTCW
jgi:cytochrome P450